MEIIVQKYGGTSVNDPQCRMKIAENAKSVINEGFHPVIVVSAMGRYPCPYATDTLLSLVGSDYRDKRSRDLLMSCGEIISTVVVSDCLVRNGINAVPVTGGQAGIRTDDNHTDAEILSIDPLPLMDRISRGEVPVVAGFQGVTSEGEVTTLGRGGSDTSATALAAALHASSVEIYTDVDGIMNADPNVVEGAEIFDTISYSDIYLMASSGAQVIHPRAVRYAQMANIDVSILNIAKPRGSKHTLITGSNSAVNPLFSAVTSISHKTQITVECSDTAQQNDMFDAIARKGINIDMINISNRSCQYITDDVNVEDVVNVLEGLAIPHEIRRGVADVTAIGDRVHSTPGVMAKIINALYSEKIDVFQTSDSGRTISVLVKDTDAKEAVIALYRIMYS